MFERWPISGCADRKTLLRNSGRFWIIGESRPWDPDWLLSHLGLARAYSLEGDTAKARAAYQDFLALWKDADPDIPILKKAKAE